VSSAETSVFRQPASPDEPGDWTGHVIVCGLHNNSLRAIELLIATGTRVVVLDDTPDPRLVPTVRAWGVPLMHRGESAEPLTDAGLDGAMAVICAESSDLLTLETALLVRDVREDVRVIVHLDNPAVGKAVEDVTGAGSVLDVAGLFAPSVISTCMGHDADRLDIDGKEFVAATVPVEVGGTLRELFGDLAPIGLKRGDAGELLIGPGRDEEVEPGDRACVIGTPEALKNASISIGGDERDERGFWRRRADHIGRSWRTITEHSDSALKITLWLGLATIVFAVLMLGLFYREPDGTHLTILQAIYFTFETGATVGFGDFSFANQTEGMQIFGISLIIVSTVIVSLIFAFITNLLVSRRIEQSLGQGMVHEFRGHTVLVGLGSVGMRVIEGLRAQGRDVAVVERDADNRYIPLARSLGVPVIIGDATLATTLDSVNLATAKSVAVLTSDDLTNIETSLAVRSRLGERWGSTPVVVRVFDRALAGRLSRSFGFHHVWASASIAAPWFVGAAVGLEVLSTFYFANEPFLVARLEVSSGGGLEGVEMLRLGADIRVIAIDRGDHLEYPPRRDTRFAAGDKAYLAGPYDELLRVMRRDRERSQTA
jgi:Trk K+ transport system NAD-binding subunit/multidrug transporter EmrE-like cation transporter